MTLYEQFCFIDPMNDAGFEWAKKAALVREGKISSEIQNQFLKDFMTTMLTGSNRHPAEIIEDITNKISVVKACCEQKAGLGELAMDKAQEKVIEQVNKWQACESTNIYLMLVATCLTHDDMACMPEQEMELPFGLTAEKAKEIGVSLNGLRLNNELCQPDLRALVEQRARPEAGINEEFMFLADKLQFCLDCAKQAGTPIEPNKVCQIDGFFVFGGSEMRPFTGEWPASLAVHKTMVDYIVKEVGRKEAEELFWPNKNVEFSWMMQPAFNRYLKEAFSNKIATQNSMPKNPDKGYER